MSQDEPLDFLDSFTCGDQTYDFFSLSKAAKILDHEGLARLPLSLQALAEGMLRHATEIDALPSILAQLTTGERGMTIPFWPGRVLLHDLLGIPAMVDIAALRDAVAKAGGDPSTVDLRIPVDFVVDHSLKVHFSSTPDAMRRNMQMEFAQNRERFEFIHWCKQNLGNLRVIPPGNGIVHQINLEYLASVVSAREVSGGRIAYPDSLVCTDSHSTMINALGILGWGVGGIEAETAMLGHALSMRVPEVLGIELSGTLPEGILATDLVLRLTELLRRLDVVEKFVEFFGSGLDHLSLPDRATISNMAPEFGATCVYFPVDAQTIDYLTRTGRSADDVRLVEAYARAQGWWRTQASPPKAFDQRVSLDLGSIERSISGPRRPEDRVLLSNAKENFASELIALRGPRSPETNTVRKCALVQARNRQSAPDDRPLRDGDVVVAAITSCTNTSNPSAMIAAGLLARKAVARGLQTKPWVKASLTPGSKAVMSYLRLARLDEPLAKLGFELAGFGCATCSGMSGPLAAPIETAIQDNGLTCLAVLSGNRNFEGRIHPLARGSYLASPPLVVAYALAGSFTVDLTREPLGEDAAGVPVYLSDIWPGNEEIAELQGKVVTQSAFVESNATMLEGDDQWQSLEDSSNALFPWCADSTYVRRPPYFDDVPHSPVPLGPIRGLRPLAILGDSITTDHLSPAGSIPKDSVAGRYLLDRGVAVSDFNSYGTRRGNHEVGMRSTLANTRLKNSMVRGVEGSFTSLQPEGIVTPIFDAAMAYNARSVPLIILAGRNYGCGSSRDMAAKGVALVGVRVVLAESFERIHRSNLVGMGILPLQFIGIRLSDLALDGTEIFEVAGLDPAIEPRARLDVRIIRRASEVLDVIPVTARLDTKEEVSCYSQGGILPLVYRETLNRQNTYVLQ